MADVKAVRHLLVNNVGLVAVVPASKITAGPIPQGTALPAIGVMHISTVRRQGVAESAVHYAQARVQVTVMAPTYPLQKSILALVRAALPRSRGTVNGVKVDAILPDLEGPDFANEEGIFMGSHDFIVLFNE